MAGSIGWHSIKEWGTNLPEETKTEPEIIDCIFRKGIKREC